MGRLSAASFLYDEYVRWKPIVCPSGDGCHMRLDERDGSLIMAEHEASSKDDWRVSLIGNVFFFHFFLLWAVGFVSLPLLLYSLLNLNWTYIVCFTLMCLHTYLPTPKIYPPFRLMLFLNIPKYFNSSSYRVLQPEKWPELQACVNRLKIQRDATSTTSSTTGGGTGSNDETETETPLRSWDVREVQRQMASVPTPVRIWLFHPHGLLGAGWGTQAWNPYFPRIVHCVATALFYTPPIICYTSHCGRPSPVNSGALKRHLANKTSLAIIPGGFEEASIHPSEGDRLFLKSRLGIFKYALLFGAELVPVFTFGESISYDNVQGWWNLRLWLSAHSIPAMIPKGRKLFWMPKRDMLHVVVGAPIPVQKKETPTTQDILDLQTKYIQTLTSLYDNYKKQFYGRDFNKQLEIW